MVSPEEFEEIEGRVDELLMENRLIDVLRMIVNKLQFID
jgi:hypothetical protein